MLLSARMPLLERAIAKGRSIIVSLSVCHTRQPRLNGSRYRNTFYTTRYDDVSGFLLPIFAVESLGDYPE